MASVNKYTNKAVVSLIRHNRREIKGNSNADIIPERTILNYSFPMPEHDHLSDYRYYKKLLDNNYIYGRGTEREKDIVTACSWVITAPNEIVGNKSKEDAFFKSVFEFCSSRYGNENIINNCIHYDEIGSPHIHIIFVPSVKIDHDKIHFKTVKDKHATKLESGRYIIDSHFATNNGELIPIKNYSKSSDKYDMKLSASEVLNKAELQHFHSDLQAYLDAHGIEGRVINGATAGIDFSVKKLKDFTKRTGLKLEDVKKEVHDKSLIESIINHASQMSEYELSQIPQSELINKIEVSLQQAPNVNELNKVIEQKNNTISELQKELNNMRTELNKANTRINELSKDKQIETSTTPIPENRKGWTQTKHAGWSLATKNNEVIYE
jgi:hypothetical protein